MLVVVVVVVLLAVVGGVVFAMKGRSAPPPDPVEPGPSVDELLVNVMPPEPKPVPKPAPAPAVEPAPEPFSEPVVEAVAPAPAPAKAVAPAPAERPQTAASPEPEPAPAETDGGPHDDDEVVVARFRVPGQRATGKVDVSKPMAPAQPVRHLEPSEPTMETGPSAVDLANQQLADLEQANAELSGPPPVRLAETELDEAPEPELETPPVVEPVQALEVVEPELVAELEPEAVETVETVEVVEPETEEAEVEPVEAVVVLEEDGEPVVILEPTEEQAAESVDSVLQALINRVAVTNQEVADAAAELVDRAGLDPGEVAEVLADLVDRADDVDELGRDQELTLFSDKVPSRPGRLGAFADLPDKEKRLVIIRVLCLLVARSDEQAETKADEGKDDERPTPLARAMWPEAPEPVDDPDLPARSRRRGRLARSR